jgi:hypothetical protein
MINRGREIERQAQSLIMATVTDSMCGTKKPGEFVKRYKKHFPLMDDFKAEHFQFRINDSQRTK